MVGPERPEVDKLLAEEVLVPNVNAAKDLYLKALATASAVPKKPHAVPRASSAEPDLRRADCAFRWIQTARADQTSSRGESHSGSWPLWPERT